MGRPQKINDSKTKYMEITSATCNRPPIQFRNHEFEYASEFPTCNDTTNNDIQARIPVSYTLLDVYKRQHLD